MDFQDLDRVPSVRLKLFLARQAEVRRRRTNRQRVQEAEETIEEQEAAILTALALMEHYAGTAMNQSEVCELLAMALPRMNLVAKSLEAATFLKKDSRSRTGSYYRITDPGIRALYRFAEELLALPDSVEAELQRSDKFQGAIKLADDLVDADLARKFRSALSRSATPRATALPPAIEIPSYSWGEVLSYAEQVGKQIFGDAEQVREHVKERTFSKLWPDAILAFPGPSLTFTGLVLATLPWEIANRVPIYTTIFVDYVEGMKEPLGFELITTNPPKDSDANPFNILVPNALTNRIVVAETDETSYLPWQPWWPEGEATTNRQRKIVAIDDTIISGQTMQALRAHFSKAGLAKRVSFKLACYVCWDARRKYGEVAPEVIGKPSPTDKFRMPWGDAACFEDGMCPSDLPDFPAG